MKIVVGSKNPVKIDAVKIAAEKFYKNVEIVGIDALSKVKDQPTTNKEAIEGALNRAKESLNNLNADIGIGIESCVYENDYGMFVSAWAVAINKDNKIGIGGGNSLLLPEKVKVELKKGRELGPIMDSFTGEHNTKQKQGTIGILTNNLITRTESLERPVILALSRFTNNFELGV